ncbi:MAG: hypothetical protein A4E57_02941 [Syntrophorhabdaceae bacterium PtaU1.Bin034]|nr:MAG: hypothetical protein A4E57_02941 [Syntrophorhabdaceae bacterium PtaU1.Bin034]
MDFCFHLIRPVKDDEGAYIEGGAEDGQNVEEFPALH